MSAPTVSPRLVKSVLVFVVLLFCCALSGRPAQAANPQIPINSTVSVGATVTTTTTGPTSVTIFLNGHPVASDTNMNGWGLALKQVLSTYYLTITVPFNAQISPNYVARIVAPKPGIPPSFTVYSSVFDVVANSLVILPSAVAGNQGSKGYITLANPAPSGGLTISLSSNQASAVVPSSVTVAANATTANFPISTTPVTTKTVAAITARFGTTTLSANLAEFPQTFPADNPPPAWASGIVPRDSAAVSGFGPSAADTVNLASGVLESDPGPDLVCYNSIGPAALFSRMYRSANAANNYGSPGLCPGWTHNLDVTALSGTGLWLPVLLKYPNGATEQWTPQVNASGLPTGAFSLPSGTPYLATGQPDPLVPGHWLSLTLTFKDHSAWTLLPDPANTTTYRLAQITNMVGHSLSIQYDSSEHITAVLNDAQPAVTLLSFTYSGGLLAGITDAFGRTITYTFAPVGGASGSYLTDVSQINSTADQWKYAYTLVNHWALLSSTSQPDPTPTGDGVKLLSNTIAYGADGRVSSLTDAKSNVHTYAYNSPTAITFTGPLGSVKE